MHPEKPERPDQILELWERFLISRLDDVGAKQLSSWLESNSGELNAFRNEAAVSLGLTYLLQPDSESERFKASILSRLVGKTAGRDSEKLKQSVMAQLKSGRSRHKHSRLPKPGAASVFNWMAAAGLVIALTGLVWFADSQIKNAPAALPISIAPAQPSPIATPPPDTVAKATVRIDQGSGSIDSHPLMLNQIVDVQTGSQIVMQSDAHGLLTLADGSTFNLIDQTTLRLSSADHGASLRLEQGRVEVHANHQNHGNILLVETPHATVRVVGTDFSIDALSDRSRVAVLNGTVSVSTNSAEKAGKLATQAVTPDEVMWVDKSGLSSIRSLSRRRVLPFSASSIDEFPDLPLINEFHTANALFGDLPVSNLKYAHPKSGAKWYSGVYWPVKLAADENEFELWIRPKSILLRPKFDSMFVFIMMQEGDTEYVLGQLDLKPSDSGWRVVTGSIKDAELNWVRPNTRKLPARADLAERLALRVCNGDIEMDYTPIVIWK